MSKQNNILSSENHSGAIYTSRLLDFKNLPKPKNADENSKKIDKKSSNDNNDRKNQNLTKIDDQDRELPNWDEKDLIIPEPKMQKQKNKKK
jgi:hypothetical protein